MKQFFSLLFLLMPFVLWAQNPQEANRAVVTLTTYDAQGQMLRSTQGYFCSPTGHVLTSYAALRGATRAEVVDAQGRTAQVERVVSASSAYDLVRLTTTIPTRKLHYLLPATTADQSGLLQTYYTVNKKEQPQPVSITKSEALDSLAYYTLSTPNEARYFATPIVNAQSQVVGIVQRNVLKDATTACAIDARAISALPQGNQAFSSDVRALHFAPLLPADNEDQAYTSVYLTLLSPSDTTVSTTMVRDFMKFYPNNTDLYAPLASYHATKRNDLPTAYACLQQGLSRPGEHRAKLYSLLSDLMQAKAQTDTLSQPRWTMLDALAAADSAYALRPDTATARQQAMLLHNLGRYEQARAKWQLVNASTLAQWDTYLLEASCVEQLRGDSLEVLRLLDAAVAAFERTKQGYGQAYLTRANYFLKTAQYRRAVTDLMSFEKSLPAEQQPRAAFFAERSAIEVKAKMYQQALDDLEVAIARAPSQNDHILYLLEKAALQLQVALLPEAGATAQRVLALEPNNADAHKLLGVSLGERKQKAKALQHLRRAQALGDSTVSSLITKYSK